jgi:hypothetical protein
MRQKQINNFPHHEIVVSGRNMMSDGYKFGKFPHALFEKRRALVSAQEVENAIEEGPKTADLSTTLRFGRDDKFAKWFEIQVATNLSSRPKRSVVERSAVSLSSDATQFLKHAK